MGDGQIMVCGQRARCSVDMVISIDTDHVPIRDLSTTVTTVTDLLNRRRNVTAITAVVHVS